MFLTLLSAVYAVAISHGRGDSSGSIHLELWQVVNLVGTPALALLFLGPVVEDLQKWFRSHN